jgi:cell division transport system permease protein
MSKFKTFFLDAIKSLKRNRTISLASVATVAATLFIFGVFLLVAMTINSSVASVESKVEIKAYLTEAATEEEKSAVLSTIEAVEGVKEVRYESKEEAFANFKNQLGDNNAILAGYTEVNNPMPNSYVVSLNTPEAAGPVEDAVMGLSGVEQVGNERSTVEMIISIAKTIRTVGVIIFVILIVVSLFLIGNTIKLTVFSRRREIGIMKFVGATDWFIRWPFLIEGVIMGLAGAVIAVGVLYASYNYAYAEVTKSFFYAGLTSPQYVLATMSWQFILAGIGIGALGSFMALRRFLDV